MPVPPLPHARSGLDRINQAAYRQRRALRQFENANGWLEAGEQAAVMSVAPEALGAPILDIGVGGGRTTPLLRAISTDYCGIDYIPEMVAAARRRFPDADFRVMDARQMDFHDGRFALAVFSYNGIDSVDLKGRQRVVSEVHRVLRPGGCFVFSTLNHNNMAWLPHWPDWQVFHGTGLQPARLFRATAKLVVGGINHLRGLPLAHDDGEVAVENLSAQNFALMALFTSVQMQIRELHEAGFVTEAIITPDGAHVSTDHPGDADAPWHHFVGRKAGTAAAPEAT
ncbi:MAG TPA: class I SAM-dependent methyltransferase [Acetobacteraceae bacterium]|nr:class I SAM-dependent methyltransferase [Acetobacteraceae bacterium]